MDFEGCLGMEMGNTGLWGNGRNVNMSMFALMMQSYNDIFAEFRLKPPRKSHAKGAENAEVVVE